MGAATADRPALIAAGTGWKARAMLRRRAPMVGAASTRTRSTVGAPVTSKAPESRSRSQPQPQPQPQAPLPDLRWLRLLVVMVAGNYGYWAYGFWSMGRDDGEPTPVLVAACLGLTVSAIAALRWPARASWALFVLGLLGWLTYARLGMESADTALPLWAGLLVTTAFFFPALALAWLARAIGRAFRPRPQDPNR